MTAQELAAEIAKWATWCNENCPSNFDKRMCTFTGGLREILNRASEGTGTAITNLVAPNREAD